MRLTPSHYALGLVVVTVGVILLHPNAFAIRVGEEHLAQLRCARNLVP